MSTARTWLAPFLLCVAAGSALGLYWLPRQAAVGDEPHYLLMADSLVRDADLDLADQYRRLAPDLEPHAQDYCSDGRLLPMHNPGLGVLIAPGYALAGRGGAVAVVVLIWSAVGTMLFNWVRRTPAVSAWAAWGGVMFTMPVFLFSVQIYTDLIAGGLLVLIFFLVDMEGAQRWRWPAVGVALGALPWLEEKFALPGLLLAALALAAGRPRGWRAVLGLLAPPLVMGALFAAVQLSLYGELLEPWRTHTPGLWRWDLAPRQAAALWFDQEFGLLPYAPFYALAPVGLAYMLWRPRTRWLGARILAVFALIFIPAAAWFDWHGGYSVPAREMVGALPLLALPLAVLLSAPRGPARWILWAGYGVMVGWSVFVMLFGLAYPSFRLYNTADGYGNLWQALSPHVGADLAALLPTFLRGG